MEPQTERKGRSNPQRLGEKLRRIRQNGGLSQGQMLLIVNPDERTAHNRARVSQYERMKRIPSLIETHNYAQYAGVPVEVLIDDNLDLPPAARPAKRTRKKSSIKRRSAKKVSSAAVRKSSVMKAPVTPSAKLKNEPPDGVEGNSETITGNDTKKDSAMPPNASSNASPVVRTEETDAPVNEGTENGNEESKSGSYYDNLLALPLVIEENESRENLSVELPPQTLDRLDDLLLDIRRELPRRLRHTLQMSDLVNFCLNIILTNYADHQKNSLVMFQTRKLIENSERAK